jgi:predicted NAD/FAD-binding protein
MNVAVIGAGISGLTAAYHLQERHQVTLFEAGGHIGGHTYTVDVDVGGERQAIDTGFIVFNPDRYPHFTRLLGELGVETLPTDMSFGLRSDRTGVEYSTASLNGLLAQRRNALRPGFVGMLRDIVRFNRDATSLPLPDDRMTVAEYVARRGYGRSFLDEYLVPLGASLWSSPPHEFRRFSIRFVIEFLENHLMLQVSGQPVWRVIRGGSRRYVDALLARFRGEVFVNRPIRQVRRRPDRVVVVDSSGAEATFGHVIMACHADQSLQLLADPSAVEREVLGAFPYQRNEVLLHTDASVMPRSRRAWASWNYHVPREERDAVSVTYNMNRLQRLRSRHVFNVTLNDHGLVRPERVLRRFTYEHPVFAPGRDAAQVRHHELIDANRTSFCGAYWGFGFHEDGVRSGLAVARALARRIAA